MAQLFAEHPYLTMFFGVAIVLGIAGVADRVLSFFGW